MRNIAALALLLGAMLLGGGLAYGMSDVSVASSGSCGSAFSRSSNISLTDTGAESCDAERSNRAGVAMALLVAGGLGVAAGGFMLLSSWSGTTGTMEQRAAATVPSQS